MNLSEFWFPFLGLFCLSAGSCCIRHLLPGASGCCVLRVMLAEVAWWVGAPASHILRQASLAWCLRLLCLSDCISWSVSLIASAVVSLWLHQLFCLSDCISCCVSLIASAVLSLWLHQLFCAWRGCMLLTKTAHQILFFQTFGVEPCSRSLIQKVASLALNLV